MCNPNNQNNLELVRVLGSDLLISINNKNVNSRATITYEDIKELRKNSWDTMIRLNELTAQELLDEWFKPLELKELNLEELKRRW
jgi:hypothetical protein